MSAINTRVVALRERAGLTQEQAAARSPYSQSTWSRIESGVKAVHLGDALAVATALGVFVSTVTGRGAFQESLQTASRADNESVDDDVLTEMGLYLEAKSHLRDAGYIQ